MTRTLKTLIRAGFVAGLLAVFASGPAEAAQPCWKQLINDWYDGRIDKVYPIECYGEALKHLPKDVEEYSSAYDDISRALQFAVANRGNQGGGKIGSLPVYPDDRFNRGGPSRLTVPSPPGPGRSGPEGPLPKAIDFGSSDADSVPIPLIVLSAIAILLLAAGSAGFIIRRMRPPRPPGAR